MTESPQDAYDRGTAAGQIEARLTNHDRHFADINGSLAKMVTELHGLRMAVQRLGDQAIARDATVVTTAAAVRDSDEARRTLAEQKWSPVSKLIAVVVALAALAGLYLAFLQR